MNKCIFCFAFWRERMFGMADTTPYLEEALAKDGYFFRQLPLVIAGELTDQSQRPGSRSFRKVLVELDDCFSVVSTRIG